ncbi:MAG: trypsin-like peptidase domain-containing protein [Oscillospiraceae bacterium]|nr:trypsin-like peptidase domain-containing protein [Oscillospiraceae bacterium]
MREYDDTDWEKLESKGANTALACVCAGVAAVLVAVVLLFGVAGLRVESDGGSLVIRLGRSGSATGGVEVVFLTPSPLPVYEEGEELPGREIYVRAAPSVVGVICTGYGGSSVGTGMIVKEDGYIVTNHHVVDGASKVTVRFSDGSELPASIVASDYISDIAVIRVEGTGYPVLTLVSSGNVVTGDRVYAIGNPLGMNLQNTMTDGMISAVNRDITLEDRSRGTITMTVLQTNCAVNPGNSGGPLLNSRAQVIGVVSSKVMSNYSSSVEGLGFAIPTDNALPIINSILEHGYVKGRPMIGITASQNQLTKEQAAILGIPEGVLLDSVERNSDAWRKGVREGDVVTAINGETVKTVSDINRIKNRYLAGDTIELTFFRQGGYTTVEITLMEEAR